MSEQIATWHQEQWSTEIEHKFQNEGYRFRGTTKPPFKIVGKKAHWRIGGSGSASEWNRGSASPPITGARTEKTADLRVWEAEDHEYKPDRGRMTVMEKDEIQYELSSAMGVRFDQLHMDVITAVTPPAARIKGDYSTLITLSLAMDATAALYDAVKKSLAGSTYCMLNPNNFENLKSYEQVSNSQWTGGALPFTKKTEWLYWNEVFWIKGPTEIFDVADTDNIVCPMWYRPAIGFAYVDMPYLLPPFWNGSFKRWQYSMMMDAEAAVLQEEGVLHFHLDSDAAPAAA